MTGLYLTILFASLGPEFAYFFHDDKDPLMRPAGIDRFAKSKGGVLHDDVKDGRVGTIDELETYLLELCGFEQGLMIQNIALAAEALGLGGFPHYGAHRFAWTRAFGFRMVDRTFAQVLHKGFLGTLLMKLMGKNVSIPQAVGDRPRRRADLEAVDDAVLPDDGSGRSGFRRLQVRARDRDLP